LRHAGHESEREREEGAAGEGAGAEAPSEESEEEAMTLKVSDLKGDDVLARDGSVGTLDDVYFDDEHWTVRYMVVDTGRWVPGRRILIAPEAVQSEISDPGKLRIGATRGELEQAPGAAGNAGAQAGTQAGDPHLRSSREVIGYEVVARDGPAGTVHDVAIDEATWRVQDLIVDTDGWWPGGQVPVHPEYVERIDWARGTVRLLLTRQQLKLGGERMPRR
jgi:sporulation protein YlmC with PRC-barrel domain